MIRLLSNLFTESIFVISDKRMLSRIIGIILPCKDLRQSSNFV